MNRRYWVGRMRGWPPAAAPAVFDSYTTECGEPCWWIHGTGFPEHYLESEPVPAVVVAADDLRALLDAGNHHFVTDEQHHVADRLRAALPEEPPTEESEVNW